MKKIMTFKEYSQMMEAALYRYDQSNISYYDPTKGWVLTFNESKKSKSEKENTDA